MGKKRIYELAKEINQSSKAVIDKAKTLGIEVKNHMATVDSSQAEKISHAFRAKAASQKQQPAQSKQPSTQKNQQQQQDNQARGSQKHQQNRSQQMNKKPTHQASRSQTGHKPATGQRHPQSGNEARTNQNRQNNPQQTTSGKKEQTTYMNKNQSKSSTQNKNQQRPAQKTQHSKQGGQQQSNRPQGKNVQQGNKPQGQNVQQGNKPQGQNVQRGNKPQGQNVQQGNKPQGQNKTNQQPARTQGQAKQQTGNKQQGAQQGAQGSNRSKNFRGDNRQQGNYQNRNKFNKRGRKGKQHRQQSTKPAVPARKFRELPEVLVYTEGMNVAEISKKIYREPAEIIKKLFMLGVVVNQNQALDKDTIELLATDYGIEAEEKVQVDVADIDKFFEPEAIIQENLVTRPPVVTIMGHVDHGKTTLLDTLRHTKVSLGEAGGITQHIGAYQIEIEGKPITFLDTPGHAAFTSMRARGASITDITILVVAADDGVMPQTVEAINHAKAADVPIIVAVNKIDKPSANPDRVMQELSEHGLIPEDWGGDTIFVPISAKFGKNIDDLLEMILLVSEVQELKADPTQRAIGTVIEARLDKGKGAVATLLVQQGTLRVGDPIVVGNTFGRVRVMTNDVGRREKAAGPSSPVEITGLNDVPQAGDHFVTFEDEKTARAAGEERAKRAVLEHRHANTLVTLDNLFESLKEGELKEVNVIIKADVQGSAEALAASLKKIDVEGVRVKIVHSAVGAINESDITLATASNAIIIGFNVRATPQAKTQAEGDTVDIRLHRVIYRAIEEIETAMKGMLDPEYQEKITGQMVVRETYKVSKVGTIAGCYVTDGHIERDSGVRVIRDSIVIFEGKLASLKRFKDDVKEVKAGYECGAMIENFNDLKVDDVVEGFIMEEIKVV
ncbi:translation initiation factor IF-2 [Vagococcus elongatus]|uniref:Translation initiation factor IF-2 n=2 Tax=Vagococcus elongatus TaxID=180344 RepID=A0A430ASJ4_9ENTE|nr:translation initiation factor IF-2 [Vagococcus elongatus]RSU11035.1 translation initiation factor IF-2 [Vagococcus elongatus]